MSVSQKSQMLVAGPMEFHHGRESNRRKRPARTTVHGWWAVMAGLLLSGCASWNPRYTNTDAEPNFSTPAILPEDRFKLAFIEFTELGAYHDERQVSNAEQLIARQKKPLVVAYIHGWHNHSGSGDVGRFKDFLKRLAATKSVQENGFTVVGVYLGWNGESSDLKGLNILTIWNRKAASERLAASAHSLDALLRIGRAPRLANKKEKEYYTIFMGHSLGANVLERTLAHTVLTSRYGAGGQMPCHLAIMLNQASDSTMASQLMSSFAKRFERRGDRFVARDGNLVIHEDQPTIVSITADNDKATNLTYPASAWASELGKTRWSTVEVPPGASTPAAQPRRVNEKSLHRSTPGNHRLLVNYRVLPAGDGAEGRKLGANAFDANLARDIVQRTFYSSEAQNYAFTEKKDDAPPAQQWKKWRFVKTNGAADGERIPWDGPDVPYWNVRVPAHLIDSHGGIWSDNSTALMAAIFRLHVRRSTEAKPAPPLRREATRLLPPSAPIPASESMRQTR